MITDAILSLDVGKRGHFSGDISLENDNDLEGNDMCNDLAETFCEYSIDNQFNVSICHFSEIYEECLGFFQ